MDLKTYIKLISMASQDIVYDGSIHFEIYLDELGMVANGGKNKISFSVNIITKPKGE